EADSWCATTVSRRSPDRRMNKPNHSFTRRYQLTAKNRGAFVLVPFISEKSRHITVEARLAGRPARFIIDTGAGGTILDSAAASKLKLALRSRSNDGYGAGSAGMSMGFIDKHDLLLHGVDLSTTKLHTLDLSHVNAGLKRAKVKPVVGAIGADVLRRHKAVI